MAATPTRRRIGRWIIVWPVLAWGVLAGAGYWPTVKLVGPAGVEAMLVAQGVVVVIVYATLLPAVYRMAAADWAARLKTGLKAGAVRLVLTLLVALGVLWRAGLDEVAFLVWLAISYLVLVKIETIALVYWNRRLERR